MASDSEEIKYIASALRRLEKLGDKFAAALARLEEYQQVDDVLRDLAGELDEMRAVVERSLLVYLGEDSKNQKVTQELHGQLIESRKASLRKQIKQQADNLNAQQEEAAKHGTSPPLYLRTQIKEVSREIERLKEELAYFETP